MKTNKKFKRGDRIYWQEVIAAWRKSGLSQNEYSRQNNLNPRSLSNWNRKLNRDNCHSIVELRYGNDIVDFKEGIIEVELDPIRLKLREGIDPLTLREIVMALRGL